MIRDQVATLYNWRVRLGNEGSRKIERVFYCRHDFEYTIDCSLHGAHRKHKNTSMYRHCNSIHRIATVLPWTVCGLSPIHETCLATLAKNVDTMSVTICCSETTWLKKFRMSRNDDSRTVCLYSSIIILIGRSRLCQWRRLCRRCRRMSPYLAHA